MALLLSSLDLPRSARRDLVPIADCPPYGLNAPAISFTPLSPLEQQHLLALLRQLEAIGDVGSFLHCMDTRMQEVFPHQMMLCAVGALDESDAPKPWLVANHCPDEFVSGVQPAAGPLQLPLRDRWQTTRAPVLVDLAQETSAWPLRWPRQAAARTLRNLACHGFRQEGEALASYFCFAHMPGRLGERQALLLRLLVPHLHLALARAKRGAHECQALAPALNERQRSILHWLQLGKTNGEIAQILDTSESNVKYHVREILAKLNVSNRAHAVARALALKLLH